MYIYVVYSRPNGWTEWADLFSGHSWVACYSLKENSSFFTGNAGPFRLSIINSSMKRSLNPIGRKL